MKAMAHDPADRYETATAMLYDMEKFRQDPAFIFPYGFGSGAAVTSGDTMPISAAAAAAAGAAVQTASPVQRPVTPAQSRPVQPTGSIRSNSAANRSGQTGSRASQAAMSSTAAAQARRAAAARRRAEEKEERNNRIAMIAVIVCTVGLFLAIAIILGVLLTGDKKPANSPTTSGIYVDSFVGRYWDVVEGDLPESIEVVKKLEYHDTVEKGLIISQNPQGGSALAPGSQVTFTVSLGKEPLEKTMEDLSGVELSVAENFLNGLGLKLNILPIQEYSDTVEIGYVIHTDPLPGQPLSEGQTIKMWYSKGPEVIKAKVPNVIGRKVDVALRVLEGSQFKSVVIEPVESNADKDEVVGMSITPGEEIDVNTQIILQVSNGPTTPPPTTPAPTTTPEPTTPPETTPAPTVPTITFLLPGDMPAEAMAKVICNETGVVVYEAKVTDDMGLITVTVNDTGTKTYTLYINDEEIETIEKKFS